MEYWETIFLLSLVPAIVLVILGMFAGFLIDTKWSGLGAFFMFTVFILFIIDFMHPSYLYYAFDKGYLIKKVETEIGSTKEMIVNSPLSHTDTVSILKDDQKNSTESDSSKMNTYHKVKNGETMNYICRKYKLSYDSIFRLNPNLNRNPQLKTGEMLLIRKND